MHVRTVIFLVATASPLAHAQSRKDFNASGGRAGIALISEAAPGDSLAAEGDFQTAFMDTSMDVPTLMARPDSVEALLEVSFLEEGAGDELRFPARRSQVRDFILRHPGEYQAGTQAERTVALVRDLSRSLQVRMKGPGLGGGK